VEKEWYVKVSIAADLHLTTQEQHPERFNALADILQQSVALDIEWLFLAGDTFETIGQNFTEFEAICREDRFRRINIVLLPGNHDVSVHPRMFSAENIRVITEAELFQPDPDLLPVFLLPYSEGKTMGEFIAQATGGLPANGWILIGHGDWMDGHYEPDPSEPGIYMPLTRFDIEHFQPLQVILGHIHKPMDLQRVTYIGSPCATAINELGRRRFITLDLKTGITQSHFVDTDIIYLAETFIVYPLEDEFEYLRLQLEERIRQWNLSDSETQKAVIHIRVQGYTSDKQKLDMVFRSALKSYTLFNDEPDLSTVLLADDNSRSDIATLTSQWIEELDWQESEVNPDKQEILLAALQVIYGA
jgi:DNA repair exonuclease SbcCD nuclease subunit